MCLSWDQVGWVGSNPVFWGRDSYDVWMRGLSPTQFFVWSKSCEGWTEYHFNTVSGGICLSFVGPKCQLSYLILPFFFFAHLSPPVRAAAAMGWNSSLLLNHSTTKASLMICEPNLLLILMNPCEGKLNPEGKEVGMVTIHAMPRAPTLDALVTATCLRTSFAPGRRP